MWSNGSAQSPFRPNVRRLILGPVGVGVALPPLWLRLILSLLLLLPAACAAPAAVVLLAQEVAALAAALAEVAVLAAPRLRLLLWPLLMQQMVVVVVAVVFRLLPRSLRLLCVLRLLRLLPRSLLLPRSFFVLSCCALPLHLLQLGRPQPPDLLEMLRFELLPPGLRLLSLCFGLPPLLLLLLQLVPPQHLLLVPLDMLQLFLPLLLCCFSQLVVYPHHCHFGFAHGHRPLRDYNDYWWSVVQRAEFVRQVTPSQISHFGSGLWRRPIMEDAAGHHFAKGPSPPFDQFSVPPLLTLNLPVDFWHGVVLLLLQAARRCLLRWFALQGLAQQLLLLLGWLALMAAILDELQSLLLSNPLNCGP